MSVIAWDGKTVSADRQAMLGSTKETATKLWQLEGGMVIGVTGTLPAGLIMRQWYVDGANLCKYPESQKSDSDFANMLVCKDGKAWFYGQYPVAIPVEQNFYAIGSGREVALGALAMGASTDRAVQIACAYAEGCGNGIDTFFLR